MTNIGALRATLALDPAAFSAGVGKAKTDLAGLRQSAAETTRAMNAASGANANLVSQFNDIGVMLAAGQNPLQLALQQGTQISQVLTGMGGGVGALRALGSAFVGMLNPVSLATIGVIGFGAAAIQWLMPAQEEAKKTKDSFEALKESMSTYNDAYGVSLLYTGDAAELYGVEAQRGAEIARKIMMMEAEKTRSSVSAIISKAYSDMGFEAFGDRGIGDSGDISSANLSEAASNLGLKSEGWGETLFGVGGLDREKLTLAKGVGDALRDIYSFAGEKVPEGGLDDYLTSLREKLEGLDDQLQAIRDAGASDDAISGIQNQMIPLQRALLEGEKERADIRAADEAKAEEMLANYAEQAQLQALTLEYGKESREVADFQAQAERDKQHALIESLNVTDTLKDSLRDGADAAYDATMQTWDWQAAMAAVNSELAGAVSLIGSIGGGMIMNAKINAAQSVRDAGGTAAAARRAGDIAGRKQEIENGRNTFGSQYFGMSDAELQGHLDQIDIDASQNDQWSALTTQERKGRSGGSGRGKKSDAEKEAEKFVRLQERTLKGLYENTRTPLEKFQETVAELTDLLNAGLFTADVGGIETYHRAIEDAREEYESAAKSSNEMGAAMSQTFADMVTDAKNAGDHFVGFASGILNRVLNNMLSGPTQMLGNALSQSLGAMLPGVMGGDPLAANLRGAGLPAIAIPSFDGGGWTGSGPRTGGLDGKGGFLGLMHTQEWVHDTTKPGGGMMQNPDRRLIVEAAPNPYFDVRVREVSGQQDAQVARAQAKALPQQNAENQRRRMNG